MPLEEDFADMDKELYTAEEAYELTMKDIKAIYDENITVVEACHAQNMHDWFPTHFPPRDFGGKEIARN